MPVPPASNANRLSILPPSLSSIYQIERELGSGVYGDVYLASLLSDPNYKVAIKKLRPAASRYKGVFGIDQTTLRELSSLRSLSHSNIVAIDDFAFDMETIVAKGNVEKSYPIFYFVFEICDTDLLRLIGERYKTNHSKTGIANDSKDRITKGNNNMRRPTEPYDRITETEIKVLMYQMLQGLAYSHAKRIVHRDLKPSNIMLTEMLHKNKPTWLVKIGDYGLARTLCEESHRGRTEEVVTMIYRGPELLLRNTNYGSEVDIWAAAAIMGELALGQPMFKASSQWEVLMKIFALLGSPTDDELKIMKNWKYFQPTIPQFQADPKSMLAKFFTNHKKQRLISDTAIDLMLRMMQYDPTKRITAVGALRHPWFADIHEHLPQELVETYHVGNSALPFHYLSLGFDNKGHEEKTQLEPSVVVNRFDIDFSDYAWTSTNTQLAENVTISSIDHIFRV